MQFFGSKRNSEKMDIVALLLKRKETKDTFLISIERLNNAAFGEEIAVGL